MRTGTTLTVLALVVIVSVGAMAMGAAAASSSSVESAPAVAEQTDENENATAGERLSGVVAVQAAELDGEVDDRSYGIAVAGAATDEEAADVVAERLGDAEQRLDELEARLDELDQQRADGELTEGQYRAKVAGVAAERANVERSIDRSNETAERLPAELLTERGVDAERIGALSERANELGGPEVAEIARGIAGDNVGQSIADEKRPVAVPGDRGGQGADDRGDQGGNATDEGGDY